MQTAARRRLSLVTLIILVILLVVGWTQRFEVFDWWRLRNYNPPAEIVKLADDTQMTDYGRRLFYVNRPILNDEITFQQNCTIDEASIVLGCYISSRGIFLFKVTDERLQGVHEVTAAHEMLHAAYERLSGGEKERIDTLIRDTFTSLADQRIKNAIANYEARDPSVVPNELHSILATEVETLPQELEDYYKRYFYDRQTIVKFSQAYEGAFEERRAKVADYDRQLGVLKQKIEVGESDLDDLGRQLTNERQELDTLLDQGRTSEYNSRVPGFNARVRSYNSTVQEVRRYIDEYNALVIERNAIALEENELLEAIDSRPDTIPTH